MKIGVVQFPGTLDDDDALRAVRVAGAIGIKLWHKDQSLAGIDAVILPGGFSYGDYLRCGAIAKFAPIMSEIIKAAEGGMPILGICNGFQVLCESNLLPGALTRNSDLHFLCRDQKISIENTNTAWSSDFINSESIVIPIKNGEGAYVCDSQTLKRLENENLIVARYVGENPNGSHNLIAGITNSHGNVVGLMPHPEHAISTLTGPSEDGLKFFTSVLKNLVS
jgi:phosphoribosylformylglycinamidine synthase subunit PurQ / glutaminase